MKRTNRQAEVPYLSLLSKCFFWTEDDFGYGSKAENKLWAKNILSLYILFPPRKKTCSKISSCMLLFNLCLFRLTFVKLFDLSSDFPMLHVPVEHQLLKLFNAFDIFIRLAYKAVTFQCTDVLT